MLTVPREIQDKLIRLEVEMNHLKLTPDSVVVDDPFELLVIARTEAISLKIKDIEQCTLKEIEKMKSTDPDSTKILALMTGTTIKAKKSELIKLVKKYPVLASKDKSLFYQRVKLFKFLHNPLLEYYPVPETPIKDAMEEIQKETNNKE